MPYGNAALYGDPLGCSAASTRPPPSWRRGAGLGIGWLQPSRSSTTTVTRPMMDPWQGLDSTARSSPLRMVAPQVVDVVDATERIFTDPSCPAVGGSGPTPPEAAGPPLRGGDTSPTPSRAGFSIRVVETLALHRTSATQLRARARTAPTWRRRRQFRPCRRPAGTDSNNPFAPR